MKEKTLIPQQIEPIIGLLVLQAWQHSAGMTPHEQAVLKTVSDLLDYTVDINGPRQHIIQLAWNLAIEYEMTRVAELLAQLLPDDPLSPAVEEGSS